MLALAAPAAAFTGSQPLLARSATTALQSTAAEPTETDAKLSADIRREVRTIHSCYSAY